MAEAEKEAGWAPPGETISGDVRSFMGRLMTGYETMTRRVVEMAETASQRADRSEQAIARVLDTQLRLTHEIEEMLTQRHVRDLETRKAEQRGEAMNAIVSDLRSLVPLGLKRLMGVRLTGNDSHGLQDLLKTFSEDQIEEIFVNGQLKLSEGQRMLLGSVIQELAKAEEERLKAAKTAELEEGKTDA